MFTTTFTYVPLNYKPVQPIIVCIKRFSRIRCLSFTRNISIRYLVHFSIMLLFPPQKMLFYTYLCYFSYCGSLTYTYTVSHVLVQCYNSSLLLYIIYYQATYSLTCYILATANCNNVRLSCYFVCRFVIVSICKLKWSVTVITSSVSVK